MQFEQDGGSYVRKPQCLCSPERCGSVTLEGKKQFRPLRSSFFSSQLCISENVGLMAAEEK